MSDASETPDGAFEATQSEASQQDTQSPPWGDDFDAERAWSTIQNLRGREKELSTIEKQWNALQNDDQAFQEFVAQRGYEIDTGDDEPEEEPWTPSEYDTQDDILAPIDQRLSKAEQFIQQQEAERELGYVNQHIDELASEAGLELSDVERDSLLRAAYSQGQPFKNLTEQAFKQHVEWRKQFEDEAVKKYVASKRAPAPPQPGVAGEEQPHPRDQKARQKRIAARIQALEDN